MTRVSIGDTPEQHKVRAIMSWYKRHHKREYTEFCKVMRMKRELNPDEFARLDGSPHRGLHEIPETMFEKMVTDLSAEEMVWFSTNDANRWFATEFHEFALARSI